MKKLLEQSEKSWKIIASILGAVGMIYGTFEIYDKFSTPEVHGEWFIKLKVENSSYRPYIGDEIGIKAFFNQLEKTVSGHGEKWQYRGRLIEYAMHDRLEFAGCVDGECFRLTYTLFGKKRQTTGTMDMIISEDGKKMYGTFTGTAADSKGTIIAERR
jgi:hypothetical protein